MYLVRLYIDSLYFGDFDCFERKSYSKVTLFVVSAVNLVVF